MKTHRILRLFTLAALILIAAAMLSWHNTGTAPDAWLIHAAAAVSIITLLIGLFAPDTRPRLMLRFLAALFALVAAVSFAADYSRVGSDGSGFSSTSLLDYMQAFAPTVVVSLKTFIVTSAGEWMWDPLLTSLLDQPAFLIFAVLAAICGFAGRPRRQVQIFVN